MSILDQITPGPWSIPHFAKADSGCPCGYIFGGGLPHTVCEVYYHGDIDKYGENPPIEQAKANARIIAHTPQMVELLEKLAGENEEARKLLEEIEEGL